MTHSRPNTMATMFALSILLFAAISANASLIITNGDFQTASESYSLPGSGTANGVLGLLTYNNNGDGCYYAPASTIASSGGPDGAGDAFWQGKATSLRGLANVITDNKATTGLVTMSIDVLYPVGAANFRLKVWGVNDSNAGTSGIQWDGRFDFNGPLGNAAGLDLRDPSQSTSFSPPSYSGTFITELLDTDATALGLTNNASWQQGIDFSFDLGGTGYDQVVVGLTMTGAADPAISGVDNLTVISGVGSGGEPFAITEVDYSPETDQITLTWRSRSNASYIAKYSATMTDGWGRDLGDGLTMAGDDEVPEDGDHLTVTFRLESGLEELGDLFFRIEEE